MLKPVNNSASVAHAAHNLSDFLDSVAETTSQVLPQDRPVNKSLKQVDAFLNKVENSKIVNQIDHFLDESMKKSEALNKSKEVRELVKEVANQAKTNTTKKNVEETL